MHAHIVYIYNDTVDYTLYIKIFYHSHSSTSPSCESRFYRSRCARLLKDCRPWQVLLDKDNLTDGWSNIESAMAAIDQGRWTTRPRG